MSIEIMEEMAIDANEEDKEASLARKKQIKATLEKCKPVKDLLVGRETEWEAVKGIIKDYVYANLMVGHEIVSRDFLAGIKMAIEIIDARATAFDDAFVELGKE